MSAEPTEPDTLKFERLVFFSDAVFAIAITLLVLDLRPEGDPSHFSLGNYSHKLFGFLLSFAVIGVYWLSHHRLFGGLWREDGPLRLVNMAFLAGIVFLPFPTSIIAQPRINNYAVMFYALSVAAVGILLFFLVLVARRPALMRPEEKPQGTLVSAVISLTPPVVFIASAIVAYRLPLMATLIWWLIGPAVMVSRVVARRLAYGPRPRG